MDRTIQPLGVEMYVRVVRFTDVDAGHLEERKAQIEESGGPPEGVSATKVQILHDKEQSTSVVLQFFDSMDDLESSEAVFSAMDPGDTPGTRVSVDRCELKIELNA